MKKYLLIGIGILSLLLVGIAIYFFVRDDTPSLRDDFVVNTEEIDRLVDISQSEVSAFVFTTQESENDHRLHINFTPFLQFKIDEMEIKSLLIRNFKGQNQLGELLLIHPTDLDIDASPRTFLFTPRDEIINMDILVSGDSLIEYEVVEQAIKFNQVENRGLINPYFGVILKDIGSVDYRGVLDRDGEFDSSKYLEYGQVSLEQLHATFTFEVIMQFVDGTVYMKMFSVDLTGSLFATETSPMVQMEIVK